MPESISKIIQQLKEFWSGLDSSQKKRIYITSAVVAVAVTVSIIFLTKPSHSLLIKGADKKEVGEMTAILDDSRIWYKLSNNGSDILINSSDNDKAQVTLALQGYPKKGMTFEDAISMMGISTTESDRERIWQQQRTSDLERKLRMLDNIEDASVTLALPEKTVFLTSDGQKSRPTACVRVKPTQKLSQEQVKGIVMLVSRSVIDLDPADVTVVDNNINILNEQYEDNMIDTISTQEEMRMRKAYELEQRVMKYFSVGQYDSFDTLRVVANPYLDFDRMKSTSKLLSNPGGMDGGAVISSHTKDEKLVNGSEGGIPGTDTNPGETPSYQMGESGNSEYKNKEEDINYDYNEVLKEEEKAMGYVVAENSTMAISLWYGQRVQDDSKLTEEFLSQVKDAASTATGIPVRNITVYKYKIAPPEEVRIPASQKIRDLFENYGFFAMMLVLVIGLLIAVIPGRTGEKEMMQEIPAIEGPQIEKKTVEEIKYEEGSEVKKQIDSFVKQKPEAVAQLLRNWISDEWER